MHARQQDRSRFATSAELAFDQQTARHQGVHPHAVPVNGLTQLFPRALTFLMQYACAPFSPP
jgi:hypothetical protein